MVGAPFEDVLPTALRDAELLVARAERARHDLHLGLVEDEALAHLDPDASAASCRYTSWWRTVTETLKIVAPTATTDDSPRPRATTPLKATSSQHAAAW